jgi:hypothetical protein
MLTKVTRGSAGLVESLLDAILPKLNETNNDALINEKSLSQLKGSFHYKLSEIPARG